MAVNIKKDFPIKKRNSDINNLIYGKIPPQCPEMEEAVIGACMLEKGTFEDVTEIIYSDECFYVDAHQKIWAAMLLLRATGTPIDLHTITEQLRKQSELEIVGGAHYLTKLTQAVLTGAHARTHAMFVMEKFMAREVIRICGQAISDAYEDATEVFDLLDRVETDVKNITAHISAGDNISVLNSFQKVLAGYEKQEQSKSTLIGISSGFSDLDDVTGGWQSPSLIIIGAPPSHGKTALMLNLVRQAAVKNIRSRVFSLETGDVNLTRRMAAEMNELPLEKIRKGTLKPQEREKFFKSINDFAKLKIGISQKTFYIEDIERAARREKKKFPDLGLIVGDFIQLVEMRNPGKRNESEIVGEVSRRLKLLSAEIEVPIIFLSQLNIRITKETKKQRPEIGNLANSTKIEQNADIIILIWHDPTPTLIVAKNKDGRTDDVKIKFDADIQKFFDFSDMRQNVPPSFFAGYQQNTPVNDIDWNTP